MRSYDQTMGESAWSKPHQFEIGCPFSKPATVATNMDGRAGLLTWGASAQTPSMLGKPL
jgi:hypothetical protein